MLLHSAERVHSTPYIKKKKIFMKAVTMKPYFSKFRNIHCSDSLFLVLNKNNVLLVFLPFLRIHKKKRVPNELHGTKDPYKEHTVP